MFPVEGFSNIKIGGRVSVSSSCASICRWYISLHFETTPWFIHHSFVLIGCVIRQEKCACSTKSKAWYIWISAYNCSNHPPMFENWSLLGFIYLYWKWDKFSSNYSRGKGSGYYGAMRLACFDGRCQHKSLLIVNKASVCQINRLYFYYHLSNNFA